MEKIAIQWLLEQYIQDGHISIETSEKALEMGKQQIINTYNEGYRDGDIESGCFSNNKDISEFENAEHYYKQTFGG